MAVAPCSFTLQANTGVPPSLPSSGEYRTDQASPITGRTADTPWTSQHRRGLERKALSYRWREKRGGMNMEYYRPTRLTSIQPQPRRTVSTAGVLHRQ